MKKLIFVLIILAVALPVFAQNNSDDKNSADIYYINIPVEKIIPSNLGYIIQYRKSTNQIGIIGIPNEWFTEAAGRAEMMRLPPGPDWPSMSVFFRKGEFSHLRLYVHRQKAHRSWGFLAQGVDVSRFFQDPDSFNIEF